MKTQNTGGMAGETAKLNAELPALQTINETEEYFIIDLPDMPDEELQKVAYENVFSFGICKQREGERKVVVIFEYYMFEDVKRMIKQMATENLSFYTKEDYFEIFKENIKNILNDYANDETDAFFIDECVERMKEEISFFDNFENGYYDFQNYEKNNALIYTEKEADRLTSFRDDIYSYSIFFLKEKQ